MHIVAKRLISVHKLVLAATCADHEYCFSVSTFPFYRSIAPSANLLLVGNKKENLLEPNLTLFRHPRRSDLVSGLSYWTGLHLSTSFLAPGTSVVVSSSTMRPRPRSLPPGKSCIGITAGPSLFGVLSLLVERIYGIVFSWV